MMKRTRESPTCSLQKTKRTRSTTSFPDWSNLPSDLLTEVFDYLPTLDTYRSKFSCSSWKSAAQSHIKNISLKSPLLFVPNEGPNNSSLIFTLEDDSSVTLQTPPKSRCVGSSRGWLLLLEGTTDLVLWHPIFDVKIHLPCVSSILLPGKEAKYLPDHWISKMVVCCSDPLTSATYGIVLLHGNGSKLAFAMCGDSKWSSIGDSDDKYADVTCHNNLVMAMSYEGLDVWDFSSGTPVKRMSVKTDFPVDIEEFNEPLGEYYSRELYILESDLDTLLVVRCIARYVDPNGTLLNEDDIRERENQYEIFPYRTKKFYVYKLDYHNAKWVLVEDLGNRVLFVGGHESRAFRVDDLPMCQKNSIYFTDDFWRQIEESEYFGGHDMGIYNLEDGSVNYIHQLDDKMSPSFWVLPY